MTMFQLASGALMLSVIAIVALSAGDPKRRRSVGQADSGMTMRQRRLLAAAACLPGLVCALRGDAGAFFIWLGGCALAGWACAAFFGQRAQDL